MKNFIKGCLIFAVLVAAMSIGNNIALLKLHDFTYYYTLDGMKLAGVVCLIETILVLVFVRPLFRWIVGKEELVKLGFERVENKEE